MYLTPHKVKLTKLSGISEILEDTSSYLFHASAHLVSRDIDCFCYDQPFPEYFYSKLPWKTEKVSSPEAKIRLAYLLRREKCCPF
jgi:hypothetical protein